MVGEEDAGVWEGTIGVGRRTLGPGKEPPVWWEKDAAVGGGGHRGGEKDARAEEEDAEVGCRHWPGRERCNTGNGMGRRDAQVSQRAHATEKREEGQKREWRGYGRLIRCLIRRTRARDCASGRLDALFLSLSGYNEE